MKRVMQKVEPIAKQSIGVKEHERAKQVEPGRLLRNTIKPLYVKTNGYTYKNNKGN